MKKNPLATANAAGATTAIVFVVCRLLVSIFPDASFTVAQSWFHGIELTKPGSAWNLTAGAFILGIISSTVIAWLVGYVFALSYNYFLPKKER